MLDFIIVFIALANGLAGGGQSTGKAEVPAAAAEAAVPEAQYTAEPQTPSGKFTTATEIKPIMGATKANWVAVREYDGQDLVYFTHILSWRCGLVGVRYSINGGPMADWPLAECQIDTAQPNAIPQDAKIYEIHPLKSVETLDVEIIYDDLSRDSAHYERKQVLMP